MLTSHLRRGNRPNQHPIVYLDAAIADARQGGHYSHKTSKNLKQASEALDGYVADTVNISHDEIGKDVSFRGRALSRKLGRSQRHLERADKFQEAASDSNFSAVYSIQDAIHSGISERDQQELREAEAILVSLARDRTIEGQLSETAQMYDGQTRPRLQEVSADTVDRNVSEHGAPLGAELDRAVGNFQAASVTESEESRRAQQAIAILEDVRDRLEP